MPNRSAKLSLLPLTALVIGSMIGGGIFSLPQNVAFKAGAGGILIGWGITFIGMLSLALVFQLLVNRKPTIEGGVYGYARTGFGHYVGFNSAWGYWVSAWVGNVSFLVVMFSSLSLFFPSFGEGNTGPAILCASLFLWCIHFLVLRGGQGAIFNNTIITGAKIIPLALFILLVASAFKISIFKFDFWGTPDLGSVLNQVKNTMLVTVWVFIGIEGAAVFSNHVHDKKDIGRATIIAFCVTLGLFMGVSILPLGVMTQPELAALKNPSTAPILATVVGDWGAILMSLGLVVSLGGAFLSWSLLAAEIPYLTGQDGTMPQIFSRTNESGIPVASLWLTNGLIQLFLIITYFSSATYLKLILLATSMILIPYLLCSIYAWQIVWRGEGYKEGESRIPDLIKSIIATSYGVWLLYAAGIEFLLLSTILYLPGAIFYIWARRERHQKPFNGIEWGIFITIFLLAVHFIYLLQSSYLHV